MESSWWSDADWAAVSIWAGTCAERAFARRSALMMRNATWGEAPPTSRPSRRIGSWVAKRTPPVAACGTIPRAVSRDTIEDEKVGGSIEATRALLSSMLIACDSLIKFSSEMGQATTVARLAKWLRRPHGPPSGVWTGQRNPQFSGKSFLTVVVFISAKNWPLCTDLKWDVNRRKLSLSATTEYPDTCIKSKPVLEIILPVERR